MKILLVNKYHYIKGGSETYNFGLAKLLESKGHKVIHFSMEDSRNFPCEQQEYFVKNVDFNKKLSPVGKVKAALHALYSFDAKNKMEKLLEAEKPDIVHINLIHRHLSMSIIEPIKKRNIPIVFTAHDSNCICLNHLLFANGRVCDECIVQHSFKPALKNKCVKNSTLQTIFAVIEGKNHQRMKVYEKIDLYICPSEFFRKKYQQAKISESPMVHWTNFLPMDTEYKIQENVKDYFLYFGRLSVEKGIMSLVKAYAMGGFENPLILVGEGEEKEKLQAFVKEKGIEDKVIFAGFQKGEALKKYVAEAKCVILPSEWYENCPYSVMEALAVGKPVVVSNYGGLPELVNDGENGFICEPFNPESLKSCLEKINSLSQEEYKEMSLKALQKAKESCDIEAYYEKLIKAYKDLIKKVD